MNIIKWQHLNLKNVYFLPNKSTDSQWYMTCAQTSKVNHGVLILKTRSILVSSPLLAENVLCNSDSCRCVIVPREQKSSLGWLFYSTPWWPPAIQTAAHETGLTPDLQADCSYFTEDFWRCYSRGQWKISLNQNSSSLRNTAKLYHKFSLLVWEQKVIQCMFSSLSSFPLSPSFLLVKSIENGPNSWSCLEVLVLQK